MNRYDVKRSEANLAVGPLAQAVFIQSDNEEINLGILSEDAVSLKMERTMTDDMDQEGQIVAKWHTGSKITVEMSLREVDKYNLYRALMGSKLAIENVASPVTVSATGNGTTKVFVLNHGQVDKDSLDVTVEAAPSTAFKLIRGYQDGKDALEFTVAPAADDAIEIEYVYADKIQLQVNTPSFKNQIPARVGKLKLIPADGSDAIVLPRCVLNSTDGELQFGKEAKRAIKIQAEAVKPESGSTLMLFIGDEEVTVDALLS